MVISGRWWWRRGILGVDPGLGTTGAVCYDASADAVLAAEAWKHGTTEGSVGERIAMYAEDLRQFIRAHQPGVVAIERPHTALGPPSASDRLTGGRGLPEHLQALVGAPAGQERASRERGGKNASVEKLLKLCGALEQVVLAEGCEYVEVQPQQAKRALTGDRRADKRDMVSAAWAQYAGYRAAAMQDSKQRAEAKADALGVCLSARAKLREEE